LKPQLIRCFFAIDIEDVNTLEKITLVQNKLQDTGANLKLVAPENIHITLKFIGEVPTEFVDRMIKFSGEIEFSPFKVELRDVGCFPNLRRINVIWVGIMEGNIGLMNLFQSLESKMKRLDLRPERRGFSPHLTITRVRSAHNRDKLAEAIKEVSDTFFGVFEVTNFKLKKSILKPSGPIYSTISQFDAQISKTSKK
jgi:2'-5' RNA ligase